MNGGCASSLAATFECPDVRGSSEILFPHSPWPLGFQFYLLDRRHVQGSGYLFASSFSVPMHFCAVRSMDPKPSISIKASAVSQDNKSSLADVLVVTHGT